MNLKDTKLEFEALYAQVTFGHGFAHYGYWPDGNPEVPSMKLMGEAQQAYFDKLARLIPADVKSILDVGSGTGSNALALCEKGYELECLCPSEQLNEMARTKLPDDVLVHTTTFEEYETDKRFDMCLFAESFHYIQLEQAMRQAARYATGYVLIFDYFRKSDSENLGDTRGSHAQFLEVVNDPASPFEIIQDEDVTDKILPTFYVLDYVKNTYLGPFVGRFRQELRANHPIYGILANLFLGKVFRKIEKPSTRYQRFAEHQEYRLILLKRK